MTAPIETLSALPRHSISQSNNRRSISQSRSRSQLRIPHIEPVTPVDMEAVRQKDFFITYRVRDTDVFREFSTLKKDMAKFGFMSGSRVLTPKGRYFLFQLWNTFLCIDGLIVSCW